MGFVFVLCLTVLTTLTSSTTLSEDVATDSKKADSLSTSSSNGAPYGWTWMSGNKNTDEYGIYGTIGTSSIANHPGARIESASWTDINGNFWLFGGTGYNESSGTGELNDLWKFTLATKEWTWMSGNKTLNEHGVYGTKGVEDKANYPGGRHYSVSGEDMDGNFWLFGGYGYDEFGGEGRLNDLWRFDITSKEWAWISGNETRNAHGVYGNKGTPNKANYPGGRQTSISWTDANGNLWIFGGYGYDASGGEGLLNDLWRFNITSKEWAWMSGNNTINANGTYGTKGVPDMANCPGARGYCITWNDTDGNLWLFGGNGYEESGSLGRMNDLWRFNITSREWAWMSGNKTQNENGVYGNKGTPDKANYPGARWCSISWTNTDGNLWLFGGGGYAETGSTGYLNDLWKYNITSEKWAWMSGNKTINVNGTYNNKGIPDMTNYPGGRRQSASWVDIDENFWLFGGYGYNDTSNHGYLNELWKFGRIEESQPKGQIPGTDGDDDDDDDGEQAIPFGNFYLLFIVVGILGGVMYYKKKHFIMKDR